jgi:hypothetical protein
VSLVPSLSGYRGPGVLRLPMVHGRSIVAHFAPNNLAPMELPSLAYRCFILSCALWGPPEAARTPDNLYLVSGELAT